MIIIKINNKKYRGVYSWDDITLHQFCELASIEMPESYKSFIEADIQYDDKNTDSINKYVDLVLNISKEDLNEHFPKYYQKVIGVLTNIPEKMIMSLPTDKINEIYEYYFKPFIVSLIYHKPMVHIMGQLQDYEPENITEFFMIGLRRFYLPKTVNIMGQDIPLREEPIVTYTEASDILKDIKMTKDDITRLAYFMAIYCRKKGERYNEKKVMKRQELFMKAPMSVVWTVFFYTLRRLSSSIQAIRLFGGLPKTVKEIVEQARTYKDLAAVG